MNKLKSALSIRKKTVPATVPLPPSRPIKPKVQLSPIPTTGEPVSFWKPGSNGEIQLSGTVCVANSVADPITITRITVQFIKTQPDTSITSLNSAVIDTVLATETIASNFLLLDSPTFSEFFMTLPKDVVERMECSVQSKTQFNGEFRVIKQGFYLRAIVEMEIMEIGVISSESVEVPWIGEKLGDIELLNSRQILETFSKLTVIEFEIPKAIYPSGFMPISYRLNLLNPSDPTVRPRLTKLKFILKEKVEIGSAVGVAEFPLGIWQGEVLQRLGWGYWTPVSIPTPQWGFNLSQTSQGFTQNGINPSGVYEKFKISHSIVCVASFDRENFVSRDCPIQVLPVTGYQLGVNPRPSYPNAIMANQTFGLGYQHPGLLLPNAFIPARPPVFGYQYGFNGLPYSNAIPITYQNHAYGNPILSPPISPISPSPYAQRSINFANATDSPFQMRQREPSGGVDYMRGGGSGQQGVGNYDEELRKAMEESELQFALEESKRLNQVEEKREFRMPEQSTSNPFADPV